MTVERRWTGRCAACFCLCRKGNGRNARRRWRDLNTFGRAVVVECERCGSRGVEYAAIARWEATRPEVSLEMVGADERFLGRRHLREKKFVTIASNLATGEPLWIGFGRKEETLAGFLKTLSPVAKANIKLLARDMHQAFYKAVRNDEALNHAAIVHDPFHVMKRAGGASGGSCRGRGTTRLTSRSANSA